MMSNRGDALRYELKYRTNLLDHEVATKALLEAPGPFRETFPERHVHSVYFDTRDLTTYRDHVDGLGVRGKVRVRWYGGDIPRAATLEGKDRVGGLTRKWSRPAPASWCSSLEWTGDPRLVDLIAVVRVSYTRRYFEAPSGLRATLDFALRIGAADPMQRQEDPGERLLRPGVLLELKAPPELRDEATRVAAALGWERVKHSKYVRSVRAAGLI